MGKIDELKRRSSELEDKMKRARWLEAQIETCQNWKDMMISGSPVSERHKIDYCLEVVGPTAWGRTPISINEIMELLQKRKERLEKELAEL